MSFGPGWQLSPACTARPGPAGHVALKQPWFSDWQHRGSYRAIGLAVAPVLRLGSVGQHAGWAIGGTLADLVIGTQRSHVCTGSSLATAPFILLLHLCSVVLNSLATPPCPRPPCASLWDLPYWRLCFLWRFFETPGGCTAQAQHLAFDSAGFCGLVAQALVLHGSLPCQARAS